MIVAVACGQRALPAESPPAGTASATAVIAAPTSTQGPLVTPSQTPTATASAAIETAPLGSVSGEWVFVLNQVPPEPNIGREDHEVWAVSANGRTTKRVAKYKPVWGGPINTLGAVTENLSRQLSPDGRKLLLAATASAAHRIFVVELATGGVTQLTNDARFTDLEPMWSPDGGLIAFARVALSGERVRELWLMRPDGGSARQLVGKVGSLFGFTARGQEVCFVGASSTYACADVSSGQTREFTGTVTVPRGIGSGIPSAWRAATPAFVGAFSPAPRIEVADALGQPLRTLAASLFGDVRWRPNADEVLVLTLFGDDWGELWRVTTAGARQRVATPLVARRAEWASDGSGIYVIAVEARTAPPPPALPPATSLHRVSADGATAIELFRPTRQSAAGLSDVTSVVYR
jgi:dipeptidyl aminopeptidase/acylaminoacyl peptidase